MRRTDVEPRKFCPFCGGRNKPIKGTKHRKCPTCGEADWRNPAPAIGVALLRDGKVLLSRRARAPKQGEWDLVGGFMDGGETPGDTARREVEEETGCKVLALRLHRYATGDYAGMATLNFLFTGELDGEPKASDDSAELKWWPLDAVPPIAWEHEAGFVAGLAKGRARPGNRTA
jgi:8-oxo-dGTP diphosphatase